MRTWPDFLIKLLLLIGSSSINAVGCASEPDLRQTLGDAVEIMRQHTLAETAQLKVVAVSESREHALKTTARIAGYPITGKLVGLDQGKSQKLVALLLDKNNYADIRQRCQNQYFHGIRFSRGQDVIEIAVGVSCNQVLAVFRNGNENKWWGGVLGNDAASQIMALTQEP